MTVISTVASRIREQQALIPVLNRALDAIGDVAIRDIYNKYISVTYTQGFDYRLFWQFVAVVVLIGAFMAFRYAQLSRFNREIQKARDQLAEAHKELQQKNARLESLATTDALTGLNNRLRLDQLIEQIMTDPGQWKRSWRCGMPHNCIGGNQYRGINVLILMMRAAVSSTDRRVTSITGHPQRANISFASASVSNMCRRPSRNTAADLQ